MGLLRPRRLRTRLALALALALLPLLLGAVLSLAYLRTSLRNAAELRLDNVVDHLYRVCELHHEPRSADKRPDLEFLRRVFLSFRVGRTGYPYAMDSHGTLVLHPAKEGQNILDSRDSQGHGFIREICQRAVLLDPNQTGTIRYPWRNVEEGETLSRQKIVKYRYFKEWDWILAAGAYEEEIYGPLAPAEHGALLLLGAGVLLVIVLGWLLSRRISGPVIRVAEAAALLADGDLTEPVPEGPGDDELALLARAFNAMARDVGRQKTELERLVAERTRELEDSRERYRSLVENTIDCIVTADGEGTITFVNVGMERLLGVERDALIGHKIWEFYEGGLEQARYIMRRIRRDGSLRNYEQKLIRGDRKIPIMTSATLLRNAEGYEVGTLGIFTDITKLKQLEAKLSTAQVNLAQTNKLRALGDLVAGVAHEVNNPLMASTTMLHVIEKNLDECDEGMRGRVELLKKCNERITRIVDHLREFSRQAEIEKQKIDVNQPLANALLISTQQLMNMQIAIERDLTDDLPPILGDANLLEQVFLDLFANARDAMEDQQGERRLRIATRQDRLDDRPAVAIAIGDTGPGIPPDVQEKIFEPFFTTKPLGKGTGLGLPTAYGIIEEHGGRIDLETEPGRGATFTIRLPANGGPADAATGPGEETADEL